MKKKEEEEADTDIWMVTFSDLLSLLLTFFVLLFALKSMDKGKVDQFLGYFRGGGMGILQQGKGTSVDMTRRPKEVDLTNKVFSLQELRVAMELSVSDSVVGIDITSHIDERGLVIILPGRTLFDSGASDIKPEAKLLFDRLGKVLRMSRNDIMIEGHTDDTPISTKQFPSNWELSTDRAVKVLRYLVESSKVPPKRFAAVGYGSTKPVVPNVDSESRMKNRRVEIILAPLDI